MRTRLLRLEVKTPFPEEVEDLAVKFLEMLRRVNPRLTVVLYIYPAEEEAEPHEPQAAREDP